jgi:hypothetical protein
MADELRRKERVTQHKMKANDADIAEESQHELAAGVLKQTLHRFIVTMRNAGQRRFDVAPASLGPKRTRVFVIVSRPIRLSEGAAPIRRVLIFDDHPATIRLLDDVDPALKRKNKLALVGCSALIVLLILAMFWPLL